jgi:hypothetical protein
MNQPSILRSLSLFALCAPFAAWASTPTSTTLTPTSLPFDYTTDIFVASNATPPPGVGGNLQCNNPAVPCDMFQLTVNMPAGYSATYPNAAIKVTESWTDPSGGLSKAEYDMYVFPGLNTSLDGSLAPEAEALNMISGGYLSFAVPDGTSTWTVVVSPSTNSLPPPAQTNIKLEFLPGQPASSIVGFGAADPTIPGQPRYQNFYAPNGTTAQAGSGEFNIGFNPATKRIMTMNYGPIWRLTPPEVTSPTQPTARPESCEALWEDVSSGVTDTGLDPILWTDQVSGRTLAINATAGANGGMYSDTDGDSWTPIAGGPNGGADHETFGTGPLPTALANLATPANHGQFAIYCSQDIVGPGSCQRSLTDGASWENGVVAYTGNPNTCGGLHGHVHIANDGTAWLPIRDCANGEQGGVISTDAGTTWSEFDVTPSHSQQIGADPSIALDSDSTAYYCYVNNEPVAAGDAPEGHVHVAVSHDHGVTWINDTDVGITHGIVNAAEPEAVGGSSGRAACGFLGTNQVGDYQSPDFKGDWFAFIATTYDGGQTWATVNATPNDPVQHQTGVWQQGGGQPQRNLLDFNEITVDDQGHALYGYSDGCVSAGCIAGTAANDFVAWMRVARQTGGKSLFAANDVAEPALPKAACLAGSRDNNAAHLTWKAPDNGGADIQYYTIWRNTASGGETFLGQTAGPDTSYDDTTADPNTADYYYTVKAVNSVDNGGGTFSNEIKLSVTPPPDLGNVCAQPGYLFLTDPSADNTGGPGTDLIAFRLTQPYVEDGVLKFAFDLETDNGVSPQPPGSSWYVAMKIADPAPATTFHYKGVHMTWSGSTPTFESYTPSPNNSGAVDGRFVDSASVLPADPSSSYDSPYNHVKIVVAASDLGLNTGDQIAGFIAAVSQTTGGVATALLDQMPDSLSWTRPYAVRPNGLCAPDVIFQDIADGFGEHAASP